MICPALPPSQRQLDGDGETYGEQRAHAGVGRRVPVGLVGLSQRHETDAGARGTGTATRSQVVVVVVAVSDARHLVDVTARVGGQFGRELHVLAGQPLPAHVLHGRRASPQPSPSPPRPQERETELGSSAADPRPRLLLAHVVVHHEKVFAPPGAGVVVVHVAAGDGGGRQAEPDETVFLDVLVGQETVERHQQSGDQRQSGRGRWTRPRLQQDE